MKAITTMKIVTAIALVAGAATGAYSPEAQQLADKGYDHGRQNGEHRG
jgi:hypothetical protein